MDDFILLRRQGLKNLPDTFALLVSVQRLIGQIVLACNLMHLVRQILKWRLPSYPVDAQIPHHHRLNARAVKPEEVLESLRIAVERNPLEKIIHAGLMTKAGCRHK